MSFDLRPLLPGIASGGGLVVAILVAFAALGGSLAFDGLPVSSDRAAATETLVESPPAERASRASIGSAATTSGGYSPTAGGANRVVPATGPADPEDGGVPAPSESSPDAPPADPAGPTDPPAPTDPPPPDDSQPPATEPPPTPAPPAPVPAPEPATEGAGLSDTVATIDETVAGSTGVDPGLAGITDPITDPLDDALGVGGG